jgi:type IV pilus assembly protein PilA
MRRSPGFSLIELMIVVAVIGILAALAIPNYRAAQLQARRAELLTNVDGIRSAQVSFEAATDHVLDCDPAPRARSYLDGALVPWTDAGDHSWEELGWHPDGAVRGSYTTNRDDTLGFTVLGATDLDDDGVEADVLATASESAHLVSRSFEY